MSPTVRALLLWVVLAVMGCAIYFLLGNEQTYAIAAVIGMWGWIAFVLLGFALGFAKGLLDRAYPWTSSYTGAAITLLIFAVLGIYLVIGRHHAAKQALVAIVPIGLVFAALQRRQIARPQQ